MMMELMPNQFAVNTPYEYTIPIMQISTDLIIITIILILTSIITILLLITIIRYYVVDSSRSSYLSGPWG
jgi:hypothetical protein